MARSPRGRPPVTRRGGPLPALDRIIRSPVVPPLSDFLDVGKELSDARLTEFTSRDKPHILSAGWTAREILKLAIDCQPGNAPFPFPPLPVPRVPPTQIRPQLERKLAAITQEMWPYIRDELTRFAKQAANELAVRDPDAKDNPNDEKKKKRYSPKRGPRNASEFTRFRAAITKGMAKGMQKIAIALEFANGHERKAKALLKQLSRHEDLPE